MTISFNEVPVDLREPGQYIEIDSSQAVRGLPGMPRKILVIGQQLSATVAEGTPTLIIDAASAAAAFGYGSMLHQMFEKLRGANNWHEAWAIPLDDDGAANAAAASLAFAVAVAVKAGTLNLYIGGRRTRIKVSAGDTATEIAAAVVAAVNANGMLAATAAVNGVDDTIVDLTARHAGEAGNDIEVGVNYYADEQTSSGLDVTITAFAGGTGNPDISTALAAMGPVWYTDIVMPYTDAANLALLEAELLDRFGPMERLDAVAYCGKAGTYSALDTFGSNAARNCQLDSFFGQDAGPNPPWEVAAIYAGVGAYEAAKDPALGLQTVEMTGLLPPPADKQFTLTERNLLLYSGITTGKTVGGKVQINRAITSYKVNSQNVEDTSYLDLATLQLLIYLRYVERQRIALRFARKKLADDGTVADDNTVTPSMIRAELIALYRELERAGLVEKVDEYIDELRVERDPDDPNRINVLNPEKLINNFLIYASKVQFQV